MTPTAKPRSADRVLDRGSLLRHRVRTSHERLRRRQPASARRRAKGVIAALSAVVTFATGVVSLPARLSPAHPSTATGLRSEATWQTRGAASPSTAASAAGRRASRAQPAHRRARRLEGVVERRHELRRQTALRTSYELPLRGRTSAPPQHPARRQPAGLQPVTGQTSTMSSTATGRGVTSSPNTAVGKLASELRSDREPRSRRHRLGSPDGP